MQSSIIPKVISFKRSWKLVKNLLVIRLDNIGDVIMTAPALQALKQNLPEVHITLLASPSGSHAVPLLPWVDDCLSWRSLWQDLGRLEFQPSREWEFIQLLKERHFDAAIIFTSFSQSPHPPAWICAMAGIPLRLGESKEKDFDTLTHSLSPLPTGLHQVERNLQLIESIGFQVPNRRINLHLPESSRLASQFALTQPYILLNHLRSRLCN
jgi:ADP-heptose:LPS heptosyltransferase